MGEVASNSSFPLASDPDENEVSVEKDTLLVEGCRAVRVRSLCWVTLGSSPSDEHALASTRPGSR
jgi:hypothetical protein